MWKTATATDPEDGDRDEGARVSACLERLPAEYREIILLRDFIGASLQSIAEETGRSSAAAARMLHARALVELGKRLRGGE